MQDAGRAVLIPSGNAERALLVEVVWLVVGAALLAVASALTELSPLVVLAVWAGSGTAATTALLFKRRWGMDLHFAMRVADYAALDAWKARLEAKGVAVEGPIAHGMIRSIYFHDPNGYRLEFCCEGAAEKRVFAEERAEARQHMRAWTEWKVARERRKAG